MQSDLKIQILIDNPKSWFMDKADDLVRNIANLGTAAQVITSHADVKDGDILFLLSCEQKFTQLSRNKHNIVVHASDLPKGKGWSPLTWQVLEGKNQIPISLFEAVDRIDSGDIYLKSIIELNGTELVDELRDKLYEGIRDIILKFITKYPNISGEKQIGDESFYRRRGPKDSELDVNLSIADQFNVFRVVDNDKYPAYFTYKGKKFYLKIYKADET